MTDPTKIPTLEDIEDSKKAMDDIQSFTYLAGNSFLDAKGVIRDTVNGRIKKMGYTVPIPYAPGIVFAANDNVKTVEDSNIVYAPLPSSLPFTTSGTFIGDDDARFFVVQGVTNDQIINDLSQSYTFKSKALMKVSLIIFPDGKRLFWQGYDIESDGGSNWGIVKSGAHTDDGGSIFTLADGKYVKANLKGKSINAFKFGSKGDYFLENGDVNPSPTVNNTFMQAALDFADGVELTLGRGAFLITETITSHNESLVTSAGVRISGGGIGVTTIINQVPNGVCFDFNHAIGSTSYANQVFSIGSYFKGIELRGDATVLGSSGIKIEGLYAFNIDQSLITLHTLYGLWGATNLAVGNPDFSASNRLSITRSTLSFNKYGLWAPENQAIPAATLKNTNVDWNGTLGILHASNYFSMSQGSISFNGYDYSGDFSPDADFGGLTTPHSAASPSLPASMSIINCEIDGNKPQAIFDNRSSHTLIRGCKFGVRLLDGETQKHMVVFGAKVPEGVFFCYRPTFEDNTITVNAGDYSAVDLTFVDFFAGSLGGHVGHNEYFFTGTGLVAGDNLTFVKEVVKSGNLTGGEKGVTTESQSDDNKYLGIDIQHHTGFVRLIDDDDVFSFKPRYDGGTLTLSGGSSFTYAIVGYSVGIGVTWEMSTISTGVELGTTGQVLTGTTGTVGRLTISAASGVIYVENRLGSATIISVSTQPDANMYN